MPHSDRKTGVSGLPYLLTLWRNVEGLPSDLTN